MKGRKKNHSHGNYNTGYELKSEGQKIVTQNLCGPIHISMRFHLAPSLISFGYVLSRMFVILQLWVLCVFFFFKSPCCFLSPPPHDLSSLPPFCLCCECQACQCHSLTWLVFLTLHQKQTESQECGWRVGKLGCAAISRSKGKKRRPHSFLRDPLVIERTAYTARWISPQ